MFFHSLKLTAVVAGRKRRRSLSPWERDRYEPRPRYGDDYGMFQYGCVIFEPVTYSPTDTHSRSHGYTSPHRGPYPPPPYGSSRRAPTDPHTLDYPATLKQYAEWFRYYFPTQAADEDSLDKAAEQEAGDGSKPRNGIRARWEKYRKEFSAQQVCISLCFFVRHRIILALRLEDKEIDKYFARYVAATNV